MQANLDKKTEKDWYVFWEKSGLFRANPHSLKKPYSLLIPPPNLTGELHLGHAMQHSILDAIARFKRLKGYDVLLLPGVDHAGIQFEATLNRQLAKDGLTKEKLGREKWLEKAWQFKNEVYQSVSKSWRLLGISADWRREVFTLDPGPRKAVFTAFKAFYDHGLIYKGPYIVQWCPKCHTAIEDVEMEYEEREEKLYFVKYLIENTKDQYIEVATTRPETIFADSGIAVYPNHPKYKKFIGKKAYIPLHPILSTLIPIFEDKRVEKDFGTGALKITPGHDLLDYQIGKDNGLEIRQVIDKQGRMTKLAGEKTKIYGIIDGDKIFGFEGLKAEEARAKTEELLKRNGSLVKTKTYLHSVAVCERCKSVIEPLISEEWFVKTDNLAKNAIKAIQENKIKFLPNNYQKVILDWLENIHDWCISRSLWWGHRIPVWYRKKPSISNTILIHTNNNNLENWRFGLKEELEKAGIQVKAITIPYNSLDFNNSIKATIGKGDVLIGYNLNETFLAKLLSTSIKPKALVIISSNTDKTKYKYSKNFFTKTQKLYNLPIKVICLKGSKTSKPNYLEHITQQCRIEIAILNNSNNSETGKTIAVEIKKFTDKLNTRVALKSPGKGWFQDEQVLDTWFSSGLWPLSTLGWPSYSKNLKGKSHDLKPDFAKDLKKYFPWDFEISAPEIKFLWIARMIMLSIYFTNKVPFKTMFFHGTLRDILGRKFSKSLGNGIDPLDLINDWGVDATRMALYTYAIPGRDGRLSRQILDERAKNFRNFTTKLRNIFRFIIELKPKNLTSTTNQTTKIESDHEDDKWILAELKNASQKVTNHLEKIELHLAVETIYNFVWHKLADVYIEKAKKRRNEAQPILEYVLKQVLILLHPFMPFITEGLYQKLSLKAKSILLERWPN